MTSANAGAHLHDLNPEPEAASPRTSSPAEVPAEVTVPHPPKLTREQLLVEHGNTLASPKRKHGLAAKALFTMMDMAYGRPSSLSKFKVLEVVARVPYQAWEHVAYVAVTHRYSRPRLARRIFSRVKESRMQQDNEQWHLLILEELVEQSGKREGFVRYRVLPQALAFFYYHLSWLLYVIKPAWSYKLNADFEDHAEHSYAEFVRDNPRLEEQPFDCEFAAEYGTFDSVADLLRQISHDERVHKQDSLVHMAEPRFS